MRDARPRYMSDVRLLDTVDVRFTEVACPLDARDSEGLRRWWRGFSQTRATLFDGPLIGCSAIDARDDGVLDVSWFRTTYAHYIVREDPNVGIAPAKALYCSIALVTDINRVVLVRMASNTSTPGRLQLPGGNVELGSGAVLNVNVCREHACREVEEEVGLYVQAEHLKLWRIKVAGAFGDVGLIFKNRTAIDEVVISRSFAEHVREMAVAGASSEISELRFLAAAADMPADERWVDYLPAVLTQIQACRHDECIAK